MIDPFEGHAPGLSSPVENGLEITPSDEATLPYVTRALYSGTGGDITLRLAGGAVLSLVGTTPGAVYPLRVDKVLLSGTTATGLVGLW